MFLLIFQLSLFLQAMVLVILLVPHSLFLFPVMAHLIPLENLHL